VTQFYNGGVIQQQDAGQVTYCSQSSERSAAIQDDKRRRICIDGRLKYIGGLGELNSLQQPLCQGADTVLNRCRAIFANLAKTGANVVSAERAT